MLRELTVDELADYIAAVKADTVVPLLEAEFFEKCSRVATPC